MSDIIKDNMSYGCRVITRISDMLIAIVAIVLFSPLFLCCYLLIKGRDGGPVIYSQERVGKGGKIFKIYKFRTMKLGAEENGPQLTSQKQEDKRLLKSGLFLRNHHLDELPQLWNVLIGDMAFVGPRPERKYYIDQIMEHDSRYKFLFQIRPGVTSYATLYNGYTDTMEKMLRRLELDLNYLEHRTIFLNLKILWMTFYKIVIGKIF